MARTETEEANSVIAACRAALDGLHVTVEALVAEGDPVTARFTARGVHRGVCMGVPPTGRAITMTGIEIFRTRDGRIAGLRGEANRMGLARQPGILPTPA